MKYSNNLAMTIVFMLMLLLINVLSQSKTVESLNVDDSLIKYHKSKVFKGLCIEDHKCYSTCVSEGYRHGACRGLCRPRCLCSNY
ncbi:hypothetical protein ABFX02_11G095200 [Erythranthe guttata]